MNKKDFKIKNQFEYFIKKNMFSDAVKLGEANLDNKFIRSKLCLLFKKKKMFDKISAIYNTYPNDEFVKSIYFDCYILNKPKEEIINFAMKDPVDLYLISQVIKYLFKSNDLKLAQDIATAYSFDPTIYRQLRLIINETKINIDEYEIVLNKLKYKKIDYKEFLEFISKLSNIEKTVYYCAGINSGLIKDDDFIKRIEKMKKETNSENVEYKILSELTEKLIKKNKFFDIPFYIELFRKIYGKILVKKTYENFKSEYNG